jgi:pimeloyl-ACP methyl ester carboxylesterase
MPKLGIDGVELAYHLAGDAHAQPVLLIHGLTASGRDWALTAKALASAGWRVLSPDCPGHGDSSAPSDPAAYAMHRVADQLHSLASALGFTPAVIVGNSMGGTVAQEYALRHPGDAAALVLVDSAADLRAPLQRSPDHADFVAAEFRVAFESGMKAVWDLHQERRGWLYAGGMAPDVQAWRKARFCRTSPEGYLYSDRALGERRNMLPDLAELNRRTLVVCCANEEPFMKEMADDLASTIPHAEYAVIPRAWHQPQLENPAAFNEALLAFLASL